MQTLRWQVALLFNDTLVLRKSESRRDPALLQAQSFLHFAYSSVATSFPKHFTFIFSPVFFILGVNVIDLINLLKRLLPIMIIDEVMAYHAAVKQVIHWAVLKPLEQFIVVTVLDLRWQTQ